MHLPRRLARLLPSLALLLPLATARAQGTGAVAGSATAGDGAARPLAGVRVTVDGSARAAVTDDRGRYYLAGLPAGEHLLAATVAGREPARLTVRVAAGQTTTADFALRPGSILLSEVVVTANRSAQRAADAAATMSVMSRERVRTSPARAADDLLREMPGVELPRASSTVSGPEEIVSMRGADEGRTLVLLDGVPLNDPWGEWIQWNRAPRSQLDRVEVVEGGGSSLYGNYAMGGVISLFTQPIVARGYDVTVSAGSRGATDLSLYGSGVRGRLGYSLGGDYGTGGGYTLLRPDQRGPVDQDNEVTRRNVTARAEYALGAASSLSASANYFSDDRSLGTPLTEPNRRHIAGGVLGATFGAVAGGRLELRAYGQDQDYDSHSSVVNATRTSERPNVAQSIPSHDLGGSLQWSRRAGIFDLVSVGGDYRYMNGRLDEVVYRADGSVAGPRTSGGSQQVGGAFLSGVVSPVDSLRVEASARVDAWRSYDGSRADASVATPTFVQYEAKSNSAFAPRVGVRYALPGGLALRGSWYRAFRAPTLSEEYRTFFSGPNTFMGNPLLTPEHLTGYDAGLDWRPSEMVELRATAFQNKYRDLDEFTFQRPGATPGSAILQRQSVGEATAKGAEGELAVHAAEPLTVAVSYNYDLARVTRTGRPVNRVPLQRGAARLTWSEPRIATVNVVYRYEGPNHTLSGARLSPFAVVDLDARRELRRGVAIFAAAENLLDREYTANYSGTLESLGLPLTVRGGVALHSF